jgi:virginiamycin B lyase
VKGNEMLQQWNLSRTSFGQQIGCLVWRRRIAACLAGLTFLGISQPVQAEEAVPEATIFGEITLQASPKNVYMESADRIWYTLPSADKLALVTGGSVTYHPKDVDIIANSQPYDLVINGGSVWFTMLGVNKIGKLDIASDTVSYYDVPTPDSEPTGITYGGGYVWFVERKGDKLGRLDPATGTILEYQDIQDDASNLVNMQGAELEDLVYLAGDVWFTGPKFKSSVALYRISNGRWIAAMAGTGGAPMQIAVDSLGNIWVTFSGFNYIGRSSINTLSTWDQYRMPAGTGGPAGLYIREVNGLRELWYTRPEANSVGRVTTRFNGVTVDTFETLLPTANAAPWGITVDNDSNAWIAASNAAKSVTWYTPYFSFFLRIPLLLCNNGKCVE